MTNTNDTTNPPPDGLPDRACKSDDDCACYACLGDEFMQCRQELASERKARLAADAEVNKMYQRVLEAESDARTWQAAAVARMEECDAAEAQVAQLTKERDAYKKAKEENDERFMQERDEARAEERERLRERDAHRAALNVIANMLRVVHEDPKIVGAVKALSAANARLLGLLREAVAEIEFLAGTSDQPPSRPRMKRLLAELSKSGGGPKEGE